MTRTEWDELIAAFSGGPMQSDIDGLLRMLLQSETTATASKASVESLVRFPTVPSSVPSSPAPLSTSNETATGSSVMETIGLVTGVGPVITGLLKLFGGNNGATAGTYAPLPYSLPEQVNVEAGLTPDRRFVDIGYTATGSPRAAADSHAIPPQIHINVQAMDSQSFADRSDDIARAVREALLRSHSLNDVIAEM